MEEAAQILEIETFIPLLLQVKSTFETRASLAALGLSSAT